MRTVAVRAARAVFGGYLAVHGAQKLFGAFDGPGPDRTAAAFEGLGLRPARLAALLAGTSELGGGLLTATGIAEPLGPLAVAGTMTVAATTHRANGPLAARGGYELALTNLAFATLLLTMDSDQVRLGPRIPGRLVAGAAVVGAALAGRSVAQLVRHRPDGA